MTADAAHAAPVVRTEERDGILVIAIDRPRARNAINAAVATAIAAALDRVDADERIAAAILTGAGGVFCAGMDLKAFVEGDLGMAPGRGFGGIVERPPAKPIIAAVEGYALAGGFELALACDVIVASETARFGLPEVTRGLVASAGGLLRLPQRVPRALAIELALTGEMIDAARAREIGLVSRVAPAGGALDAALELARRIANNAPLAVRASLLILRESGDWRAGDAFARQAAIADPISASEDAREGATAFAQKRPPVWRGR